MIPKHAYFGCVLILIGVSAIVTPSASGQPPALFSFSLPGSTLTQCWFYAVGFSATSGQAFVVQWNESNFPPISVNFYIVPQASLHTIWNCLDGPVTFYFNDGAIGSASWTAPAAGDYAVILANFQYTKVSGSISMVAVSGTLSATPIGYGTVRPYNCVGPSCNGGGMGM